MNVLLLIFIYVYLCVHVSLRTLGDQKRVLSSLELELQVVWLRAAP